MGGFEASSHCNGLRERIDMIAGTRHEEFALVDYQLLQSQGMQVARDAFRWHLIDTGIAKLNFSSALSQIRAAVATQTQVIWSLSHYGYPNDLDLFSAEFVDRYVRFSIAAARLLREHTDEVPYFTPINEISFFTWAGSGPGMAPYAQGRDAELKRQLVRASLAACHELRSFDPRTRFVHPEPIIQVVPPLLRPDLTAAAAEATESQFEAWDMIAGRKAPELGGSIDMLDILGMNFYHSNQWELGAGRIEWEKSPRDLRWTPLSQLIQRVWLRYQRPLFLAETSHVGVGRPAWILEVAHEIAHAHTMGVPFEGICLFPILDRYEWDNPSHWHNSGLWDLSISDNSYRRILNSPYADALIAATAITIHAASGLAPEML